MTDTIQLRIIEAAGPIFAQKGFAATTVREICAAAKVNQAAINYYFGSKESLYKEVFDSTYSCFTPLHYEVAEPDRACPFEERFHDLIVRRTKDIFATEITGWKAQLLFRELHDPTPSCGEQLREFIIRDYNVIYRYLDEYFDSETPEHIRWKCIFGLFGTIFFYKKCGWLLRKIIPEDMRQENFKPEQIALFAVQSFFAVAAPYRKQQPTEYSENTATI
ncbi:MAG: TetR/AcrR family transcriptional regulator [Planctomycetaceae bacterium]|jgi:AcrR family transcriptional regulator|nr:TetR/AcrR family transcriptional regulator [Planctomycetaceae bacterium]